MPDYLLLVLASIHQESATARHHVGYLLGAYFEGVARATLQPDVRQALQTAVYNMFDVASSHELQHLFAQLSGAPAARSMMKAAHRLYNAQFKFDGKV